MSKLAVKYIGTNRNQDRFTPGEIYMPVDVRHVSGKVIVTIKDDDGVFFHIDTRKPFKAFWEFVKVPVIVDTQWFISYSYSTPSRSGFGNLSVKVQLGEGQATLTFETIQDLEEQISKECYNGVGKVVIMNFVRIEG